MATVTSGASTFTSLAAFASTSNPVNNQSTLLSFLLCNLLSLLLLRVAIVVPSAFLFGLSVFNDRHHFSLRLLLFLHFQRFGD